MFHPDLRLLRSFVAVASESSVTRAAEKLNLTQPTVSGQIKELELAVECALFHRTTRSITLTAQGEHLLPAARRVLDEAEGLRTLVDSMQRAGKASFRLGAALYTMDIGERASLLSDFTAACPDISYLIDNRMQSAQIPDLADGRLDVSVLLGLSALCGIDLRDADATPIFNESQYPDTLDRIVLRRQPMSLLIPEGSDLAEKQAITVSDFKGLRVATLNNEHGCAVADPIMSFLRQHGAEPIVPAEGNAIAVERYAAQHGICCIGIGWFAMPPGLVARPVKGLDLFLDFAVVLGANANHAARRFFDFARQWQAARDAGPVMAQMAA